MRPFVLILGVLCIVICAIFSFNFLAFVFFDPFLTAERGLKLFIGLWAFLLIGSFSES